MTRTITAYFDGRSEAEAAASNLADAGVSRSSISVYSSQTSGTTAVAGSGKEKGVLEAIGDFFMPDEDRYGYEEGIRRGGAVLTVKAEDADFERVSDMLEDAGSVDLDTRESEWRSQGWSGYDATAAGSATTTRTTATTGMTTGASMASGPGLGRAGTVSDEETIPVLEEQLRVGKREVDHGRVRIRSYVVETPVEESVSLRSESVHVERRHVDRPVTDADAPVFQERVLEAEESSEEAVVSKQARVVEEIGLTKSVQNRNETVSDTVRRTEVEVEDERTGKNLSGSTVVEGTSGRVLTDEELARNRR